MLICQQFMLGAHLKRSTYPISPLDDHEHCTMCGAKFSKRPDGIPSGLSNERKEHLKAEFQASWDSHIINGQCEKGFDCGNMA